MARSYTARVNALSSLRDDDLVVASYARRHNRVDVGLRLLVVILISFGEHAEF
jgi:hypothetical protein